MNGEAVSTSPRDRLARRLEDDIRRRALRPGDRYYTAAEAGHALGVSAATAHRAMCLLTQRGWLTRSPSRGTFIGPKATGARAVSLPTVHMLFSPGLHMLGEQLADLYIRGIRRGMPDANVQFSFLREGHELEQVRELVERAGPETGFLATSGRDEVYHFLLDRRVPMALLGSPYGHCDSIAHVDVDNRAAGEILARYLLDQGHRRLLLLWPEQAYPGDHDFFDGASAVLTDAGLPHDALMVRVMPRGRRSNQGGLKALLGQPDPPTAMIGRQAWMGEQVRDVLEQLGEEATERFTVTTINHPSRVRDSLPWPCVRPTVPMDEIVALAAGLLAQAMEGTAPSPPSVTVPMELHLPDRATEWTSELQPLQPTTTTG
jgi:DNA-binding LacI/PurR family transcriptional regulator